MKRLAVIALAGCATFEDPNIVIDIRALAMHATVPEQVIDIDLNNPPQPADVLQQLVPSTVCMLVADPTNDRHLRWTMTLCPYGDGERCDDDHPQTVIGQGLADDPENGLQDPKACAVAADMHQLDPSVIIPDGCACATVNPDGNLLAVLLDALDNDPLKGFQGLDYEVMLRVGGEGGDPDLDQYAAKGLRLAARIPTTRTANKNPSIRALQGQLEGGASFILDQNFLRCADQDTLPPFPPNTKINLFPVESGDARETYVVPTLDGGSEMFTEALTYQWVASGGGLSRGDTGGPHDAFGNDAPLDTDWTSPPADKLDGPTDFTIWIVQRDERFGVSWYETCFRVTP